MSSELWSAYVPVAAYLLVKNLVAAVWALAREYEVEPDFRVIHWLDTAAVELHEIATYERNED